jgi:hypothetical protein
VEIATVLEIKGQFLFKGDVCGTYTLYDHDYTPSHHANVFKILEHLQFNGNRTIIHMVMISVP